MAGTLTISTLSDGTNSTSSTNCIQGSAKAWVNFNGVSGASIRASYNVSSVTRNGTGDYTINFTNAMSDANYSQLVCASDIGAAVTSAFINTIATVTESAPTSAGFRFSIFVWNNSAAGVDQKYISAAVFR